MPHEKGQGAASSFDSNLYHSWRGGAVKLATFILDRVTSQLRGSVGYALGIRNLRMPIALSVLVVLAGYYAGGIVGIRLGFPPSGIAAMWPSTAILLAALLLTSPRSWWVYLLGVVPTHLHLVANFQVPEVPLVVMFCQVASNILHAVLAALALRFVIGAPPQLASLRNMGAFILLAGVVATAIACVVAVWLFLLTGWTGDFWLAWRQRTLANVFATVTIPPVIVLTCAGQLVRAQASWRSYLELALITLGVLVVGIPVFGLETPGPTNVPALLLAPLPFLMWAAVRVGVSGTGLTLLIVAGIALANAYVGRGPFISHAPFVNVLSLQIFLTAISIPLMLLAALVEERRQEAESLKHTTKKAELALAERSLQLALAGKAALVGSFAFDVNTDKIQISAGYAAIHDFPDGTTEIKRSEWQAGVHCEDLVRVEEIRSLAFRRQLSEYSAEYRIVRSAGEVRWIESHYFVSYRSDGRPLRVIGVNIDVTERKRSEAALEESRARYRALYDDNPSMYFTVDAAGTVLSVNEFGALQLGYRPAELVGRSVLEVVHEGDREGARRWLASCAHNAGTIATTEVRKIRRDGSTIWVREVARAVQGFGGQALIIVCEDITERKKAELALAERTMQLALAGKAALVGSFAYDLDTERLQISSGYAAIHGFPDGTTEIARSVWQLGLHPEERVRLEEIRSRCFRKRQDEYGVDYRIVRSESDVRWIDARCFVSYHGDGRPKRVVGVDIDVTERKRAEEHHRAMNAELDHRVKNVLATVQAIAAQTMQASSSMEHFVASLDGRIRSMGSTHELLSHRRWLGIPLAELVERELAPYTTGSNTEIGGPEVMLRAEAAQTMAMVLHELVTNAAKYGSLSTRDGRVSVRWYPFPNGNADARLCIEWQETDGPPVEASERPGYGMEIIRGLLPYELEGEVNFAFATEGVRCRFSVPLSRLTGGDQRAAARGGALCFEDS